VKIKGVASPGSWTALETWRLEWENAEERMEGDSGESWIVFEFVRVGGEGWRR
jgi:hypothetical protein